MIPAYLLKLNNRAYAAAPGNWVLEGIISKQHDKETTIVCFLVSSVVRATSDLTITSLAYLHDFSMKVLRAQNNKVGLSDLLWDRALSPQEDLWTTNAKGVARWFP